MKLILTILVSSAYALLLEHRGAAFSVDTVPLFGPQQFDPTAELSRLWSKYPSTEHVSRRQTDLAKQEGSAIVQPIKGSLTSVVPTVIGNQTFQMIYDTGSADLWVYSNESSLNQDPDKTFYIPSSSANLLTNYTWAIKYAGGSSLDGIVYTDVVKVGLVVAEKQAVESAINIPFDFPSDGIMGLAFGIINQVKPVKQTTFFETVAPTLRRKVFAANLKAEGNGTWDFGYIDKSKYTGEITYTPVVGNQKHWTIALQEYAVGNNSFGSAKVGEVILDSGTSLVYLPESVVADYYSKVPGYVKTLGGTHSFPCNNTIPDLHFKIESRVFSLPGRVINYAVIDPTRNICAGALDSNLNMRYAILGSLFMQNYYVIHSQEESMPRVGLAPQS